MSKIASDASDSTEGAALSLDAGATTARTTTSSRSSPPSAARVAVLIPCYNESLTIERVVSDFREELPEATIYVFDNSSTDDTVEKAKAAGAIVYFERRRGKGYVIQSMFRHVDADVYVMVDGDNTYPANAVHELLEPIGLHRADMVVGSRLQAGATSRFNILNRLGNMWFLWLINALFRAQLTDILSGYRAFTRQFVKHIPLFGHGFEIETELTIKALERGFRIVEVPVDLGVRPPGSFSKIRIMRDGLLILGTILALLRDYKPLTFFGSFGLASFLGAGAVFLRGERAQPDFARPIWTMGLILIGTAFVTSGFILHTLARRFQEFDFHLTALEAGYAYVRSPSGGRTKSAIPQERA